MWPNRRRAVRPRRRARDRPGRFVTQLPVRLRLNRNRLGSDIPSALEAYRALRADGGDNGKQIKSVLERLRADPGKVRGESLRYLPGACMVLAG